MSRRFTISTAPLTYPPTPNHPRLQRYRKQLALGFASGMGTFGLAVVLFWFGIGLLSLWWTPYEPTATDFTQNAPLPWTTRWAPTTWVATCSRASWPALSWC